MRSALILLLLLALGALGAGIRSGPGHPAPHAFDSSGTAAVVVDRPIASATVSIPGTLARLNWVQVVVGTVNTPGDKFTVAVTVGGTPECTLEVACDAAPGDSHADCSSAFSAEVDVDVKVTASDCLAQPTGFATLEIIE
jgi:hypothetical protein